jgi:hypothetical protein
MPEYLVSWTIGIIEAEDPLDAASKTLAIQRDPDSIATVFEVTDTISNERSEITNKRKR